MKVTDFGLARLLEDDPALTKTFQVVGTPLYMAPEQARGDRRGLTARADVYALGAILYELLAGQPPHAGGSQAEVLARLQNVPAASPRKVNPGVPRDLAAVCLKCLEHDPDRRYQSAAGLADDLDRFLAGRPVTARLIGPAGVAARWVARRPFSAALVVLTAASVLAAVGLTVQSRVRRMEDRFAVEKAREHARTAEFYTTLERVRQRRTERAPGWTAANIRDVARLAATPAVPADELPALRTEAAAALTGFDLPAPRVVAGGFKPHPLLFAPNGRTLALGGWRADDRGVCEVRLIDTGTGDTARRLTFPADPWWRWWDRGRAADGCRSLAFSPDGRWLVAGTRSGWLFRWDLHDPDPRPVRWRHTHGGAGPRDVWVRGLAFSPTGRVLLSADEIELAAWDTAGDWSEAARVARQSGHLVSGVVRQARPGDPAAGVVDDTLYQAVEAPPGLHRQGASVRSMAAAGPGGQTIATWGEQANQLRLVDVAAARAVGPLALPDDDRADDRPILDLAVSPDGLLLAAGAEHAKHLKVWGLIAGRVLAARSLTGGSGRAAFSPDGRTLAVTEESRTLLYSVPAPGAAGPVAGQRFPVRDLDRSADGRTLATVGVAGEGPMEFTVWADDPAGAPRAVETWEVPLHPSGNNRWGVALGPDGRVAFPTLDHVACRVAPGRVEPRDRGNDLRDLRYGPGGVLWGCADGQLYRWAGPAAAIGFQRPGMTTRVSMCVAPGRSVVLTGLGDGAVCRLRPDGRKEAEWPAFTEPVTAVGLSPDEQTAVAGTEAGGVAVFRVADGTKVVGLPAAHRDAVEAVAVGPNGWFATGSWDRTVSIWSPDGRPILTLFQNRPVRRLVWSPDGRYLTVLADRERGLRRWDLDRLKAELADLGLDPDLP